MGVVYRKKLNHEWDKLLSPEQKELLVKPGFGLSKHFPYMNAVDVKNCMDEIESIMKIMDP